MSIQQAWSKSLSLQLWLSQWVAGLHPCLSQGQSTDHYLPISLAALERAKFIVTISSFKHRLDTWKHEISPELFENQSNSLAHSFICHRYLSFYIFLSSRTSWFRCSLHTVIVSVSRDICRSCRFSSGAFGLRGL